MARQAGSRWLRIDDLPIRRAALLSAALESYSPSGRWIATEACARGKLSLLRPCDFWAHWVASRPN
jgi:hypothetical protein